MLRSQLVVAYPGREFTDDQLVTVLRKVGLEPMADRVGGLDAEHDWSGALSPEENRLLALARVLLASPRFAFLDRMDGDLTPERIEHIYQLLTEAGISYLSVGDHYSLPEHHDAILNLGDDGAWQITTAQPTVDGQGLPQVSRPLSTGPGGAPPL